VVDAQAFPPSLAAFEATLADSLAEWAAAHVKVVWLEVASSRAHLLPAALSLGFAFHHCRPDTLVLTRRLVPEAYLPEFATHGVGVGGVVLTGDGQLLAVVEQRDAPARPYSYKLPGGMLEAGEHMADGIVREVREETGVIAECEGLLSLRHRHDAQFGRSNIYAVFRLRALSRTITADPEEIHTARWMPVEEFLAGDQVGIYNRHVVQLALRVQPLRSTKLPGYMHGPGAYEIY
jgi:8-oxo-dGTP diphosphatase